MARIRNLSNDDLIIGYGFPTPRRVKPDETIVVPDEVLSAYVERVEGIVDPDSHPDNPRQLVDADGVPQFKTVPSDLWVEVPDITPAVQAAPVEENQ